MSTRWTSSFTNNQNGTENSRPYVSSPTVLACRMCDQIFLNFQSLLQHYETHAHENAQRNQNHETTRYISNMRVSSERNLTNNPFQPRFTNPSTLQQRHHPYFPTGYGSLQRERISVPQTRPLLASRQIPTFIVPRPPVANNNVMGASFQASNWIPGRNVARGNPFVIQNRLSSAQRVSPPQRVPIPKLREQKGRNKSAEPGTVWYLSQLEKPIPKIIDLVMFQVPEVVIFSLYK